MPKYCSFWWLLGDEKGFSVCRFCVFFCACSVFFVYRFYVFRAVFRSFLNTGFVFFVCGFRIFRVRLSYF